MLIFLQLPCTCQCPPTARVVYQYERTPNFGGACDVTILLFKKLNYNKESRIEVDHNNQDGGRKAKSSSVKPGLAHKHKYKHVSKQLRTQAT